MSQMALSQGGMPGRLADYSQLALAAFGRFPTVVTGRNRPIAVIPSEAMSWMAYTSKLWSRHERVFASE
ncbi:hypothetical protein, partial [Pseudomonas sp. NPDC087336]|uniref:hypothetical protein n=1 Tax=Pseudomonas sp. NPDC087336 TaxID=3364436 RepID=UPI0038100D34